ncbi:hypothetical protein HYR99_37265 [Candidatus Poribacteria bacterium]|nr:hypothetical protein [Candidatus Poribacteria bacterium]
MDITSIEDLSYDELKTWIALRLHDKDTQIPSDFRQGDTPYYIISLLYPKFSRHLREDIHRIVREFVRDMARNPETIWVGEAGHQLLLLVNAIHAEETRGFLLEMAESRQFFVKDAPSLAEDLHFRVLQTLAALEYRSSPEFWHEQYQLAPERYAKIVFNGLSLIAPEQAIRFMSSIGSVETVEHILLLTFPTLLDEYGISRIAPIVEKYLPQMKPEVRQAVMAFFEEEDYLLRYQPRSEIGVDRERILNVFSSIFQSEGLTPQPLGVKL